MATRAVIDGFASYLAANWTALPVIGPNNLADRPTDRWAFLGVQYPATVDRQVTFGTPGLNVQRQDGVCRLVIHVAVGEGLGDALVWADDLIALFRNKRIGDIQTFSPTSPVFDDRNEDGGYYRVSIAVPYTYDTLG